MKVYGPIGSGRLLYIRVLLDGEQVYEGQIDDAPEEIRALKYYQIDMVTPMTYHVRSEDQ